ncbi:S-layer homology domain-containing protein [Solibacillus sp. FSL H8-0523]|uniref:S-layer homology domain-containing protein n=1 Tax=Solibacillus sp. FSL H8-0523 TaxID=2954511 RepID=UPI003100D528
MKKKMFTTVLASAIAIPAVVVPVSADTVFTDISPMSEYAEAVQFLSAEKLITGYSDHTFRPEQSISRQHVISIINNAVDLTPIREAKAFSDVPTNHPYSEAIQKAYRAGIIDGYEDSTFKPDQAITRAQAAKVMALAFKLQPGEKVTFQDVAKNHWSMPYIQAFASSGVTTTGLFHPNDQLTRGHYALFLYRLISSEEAVMPNYSGNWSGTLDIPQSPLNIQLHLSEDGTGTFSVPAQALKNHPIKSVTQTGNKLRVEINLPGAPIVIEGTVEQEKISATFSQSGMELPITLTPFVPEEVEVTYDELVIPVTGGELKVALQMPTEQSAPVPVGIIIAGSGPTTKDGNTAIGENNSYKMLAEELAEKGIATIRYDKRGIGENTALVAKEEDLVFDLYAQDVERIVKAINADPRFSTVHVIGHSEGSLVGMVAATSTKVDSVISLAGAGRPVDDILIEQLTPQLSEELLKASKNILAVLKKGDKVETVPESLYSLFRPSVQPYMISWLQYDPSEILKSLDVETLIIQGKNDVQVKVSDAERLSAAKPSAKLQYFDTMNHVLKDSPTDLAGNIATYTNPTLPLAEGLVDSISSFILKK